MAGTTAARPAGWPVALQQVFEEPWRLRPAFQPILDLERGTVWGFQALARFISPQRASPPEWLEAAAALGLRTQLEERLLVAALDTLDELPDRCRVLLPLGADTVAAPAIQRRLSRAAGLARRILLDITAASESIDVDDFADAIEPLRRDGGGLALLAGASPGGLDALPRLRPDVVKVGREYVAGVASDGARRAVVEGLVALVQALGGRVLAVGIEDQGQLDALAAAGIALGQGFGLGRPLPSLAAGLTRAGAQLLVD
jgi:EAL domain-containing protein (putative c-di-GMP-specific phosphodiesterase class I)